MGEGYVETATSSKFGVCTERGTRIGVKSMVYTFNTTVVSMRDRLEE